MVSSLDVNPTFADISITNRGSNLDWAIFAIMLAYSLVVFAISHRRPVEARIFHLLISTLLFISAISYFTMASNLGYTAVLVQQIRKFVISNSLTNSADNVATRAIWYARYIGWTFIFPFTILTLLLITGLPLSSIFLTIFWSLVMIITRLIGALVDSSYKWGYFALSIFATFYVIYMLLGPARNSSHLLGPSFNSLYTKAAAVYSFLLILYPVAWGLSEGGNVIHPDSEMVFYAVLDYVSQPLLLTVFLSLLVKTPFPSLSFNSSLAGHSIVPNPAASVEKGLAPTLAAPNHQANLNVAPLTHSTVPATTNSTAAPVVNTTVV